MSNDWLEEQALRFEGFNDAQIAQIKAAIPQVAVLFALYKKNQTDIMQAVTLLNQLAPVGEMVATTLKGRLTS
jgi:hypothetical protein